MSTPRPGQAGPDPLQYTRLEAATAHLDPPFVAVDLAAFDANADDLLRRAAGVPIRVASKSVRVPALLRRVLARDGFAGVLSLTLPEALHLVKTGVTDDVVVGYPSVDRAALAEVAAGVDRDHGARVAPMVDDVAHLDLLEACGAGRGGRPPVRVVLELDASLPLPGGRRRIGVRRSPIGTPQALAALAAEVVRRPAFELLGIMAYEAQIAGVGDRTPGAPLRAQAIRAIKRRSRPEIAARRAAAVAAVAQVLGHPVPLVNGGGTGSLESTGAEPAVTEVAAGSGLLASTHFDAYAAFAPAPAAFLAIPVVRRPGPGVVTAQGGGWIASGAPGADVLPVPWFPPGLRLDGQEGAGEAQTPLLGAAADRLRIGDRVWLRPAKAGEPLERIGVVHLVGADPPAVVDVVPTYRGEGFAFG